MTNDPTNGAAASSHEDPPPQLARALVRSLGRGTAIAQGVRHIHVGHDQWLAAQHELLAEVAEDGHSETKFVRGAYGAGKSHFLSVVQDRARRAGWCTAHVECKVDHVQIDRFETLLPNITGKLLSQEILDARHAADDPSSVDSVRFLLERWTLIQLRRAGIRADAVSRPFDASSRLNAQLQQGLLISNLSADFTRALASYAHGKLSGDVGTTSAVTRWLRGTDERLRLPEVSTHGLRSRTVASADIRPIGKGTAQAVMRGVLWLVRAAGYSGLVLCIDEVEELSKLGTRKRQDQALQALREYVDHAGGEGGYRHLAMYLAATPEMFEGPDYFPRYDALATRIQAVSGELNWRAPVIDLDRTPLEAGQMREMALRIEQVHRCAYPTGQVRTLQADFVDSLLAELLKSKMRIAKPRLLARIVVDELERARQLGPGYAAPTEIATLVGTAASRISREEGP